MADQLSLQDWMSEQGIAKWMGRLGTTDAPLPRANVRVALQFFATNMPSLPPTMALNFLLAMDLSRPVRALQLSPLDRLIAFRSGVESPFKLFYTRSGASAHSSGINPFGRTAVRFRPRMACPALESWTTGAKDVWSLVSDDQQLVVAPRAAAWSVIAFGGGVQLIVPNAHRYLEVIPG